MIPLLKSGQLSYGLLPEPAATNLENLSPDKEYCRLSLQEMYDFLPSEYVRKFRYPKPQRNFFGNRIK